MAWNRRRRDDIPTSVAVIGAGIMGTNHARVISTLADAEVVAVVDPDNDRARALASAFEIDVMSIADLRGEVDAAVVATSSETHADVGCELLAMGIDVLVEKPMAASTDDAKRLIECARANDRILMAGHVERFNAAIVGLRSIVENPVHIEFTRSGPFSSRIRSDVVLDLMIHDLDLLRMLTGAGSVDTLHAVGRTVKSDSFDFASCLATTDNGVSATLTASRAGQNKIRMVEVTQRDSFIVADLLRQDINVHRVEHNEYVSNGGTSYRQSGVVEIPFLERTGEPLRAELEAFVRAVRERSEPPVTGEDGLAALELAQRVSALVEAN